MVQSLLEYGNINAKLSELFIEGHEAGNSSVNPKNLHKSITKINKQYAKFKQEDGSILYRYLIDALIQGELNIKKAKNSKQEKESNFTFQLRIDTPESSGFKSKETFLEKKTQFYLATNVKCMACDYNSWNFTLSSDLILDIVPRYSQTELNIKLGHGMDSRIVGSKVDAINAQEDKDWANDKKGRKKKGKKKKKHKGRAVQEVNKKNILGGEGGLLAEEFDAEKWADEKTMAQQKLDALIEEDRFMMENGNFELLLSKVDEEFPYVNPDVQDVFCPDHIVKIPKGDQDLRIEDCLDNYFITRMLNNHDNHYYCPECRKKVEEDNLGDTINFVTKFYRLHCAPDHFAVSLKRFKMVNDGSFGGVSFAKNDSTVLYGLELDLTKYYLKTDSEETIRYKLTAVMLHSGSLRGGHYTAYACHKNEEGHDIWYHISDNHVSETTAQSVLNSSQAFMLFYTKLE